MSFPSHEIHNVPKIASQAAVLTTTLSRTPNQEVMRVGYTGTTRDPKVLYCPRQVPSARCERDHRQSISFLEFFAKARTIKNTINHVIKRAEC